jgi:hypothetical protein
MRREIGEKQVAWIWICQVCFCREASESAADAVANVRRTRGVDHLGNWRPVIWSPATGDAGDALPGQLDRIVGEEDVVAAHSSAET